MKTIIARALLLGLFSFSLPFTTLHAVVIGNGSDNFPPIIPPFYPPTPPPTPPPIPPPIPPVTPPTVVVEVPPEPPQNTEYVRQKAARN